MQGGYSQRAIVHTTTHGDIGRDLTMEEADEELRLRQRRTWGCPGCGAEVMTRHDVADGFRCDRCNELEYEALWGPETGEVGQEEDEEAEAPA